jgi:hypothetical protein
MIFLLSLFFSFSPWHFFKASAAKTSTEETEEVYSRNEGSIFTIEIHTGNKETKSVLGSGYLIDNSGTIVTNFHVVDSFIEEPSRYFVRVKNKNGTFPATLRAFDIINDLALLHAEGVSGKPLKLAPQIPAQGSSIVSLGNPLGFHLSIIRGIFNGFAEKGLIDRMLLSMPLNSGMSGGPILNRQDEVIGTNVSIIWLSNSLSFGVPSSKIPALLAAVPLQQNQKAFRDNIRQQLFKIEKSTSENLQRSLEQRSRTDTIQVGKSQMDRPPDLFDCWDSTRSYDEHGISKSTYSCNLQFTPTIGETQEVASVELLVEHLSTRHNSYGFYGFLTEHADAHHGTESKSLTGIKNTAPECVAEKVKIGTLVWKINTCLNAYVDYPGLYDFAMVGTTLNRPKEALYLALHMKAFRYESFRDLSKAFLEKLRFMEQP